MTKGRRAAIYARYSTHSQRSESIEIQLDASRAYCAENGLMVVAEYCDYAQTGTTTDRAEFQRMMADARRGLFDYVVIYKVTRIMRNRDEMAMARIMLRRSHVEILYAGEGIRDGIRKNAERAMANGCVRCGWDIVDGRYVVNEEEAAVVRMGARMILEGRSVADVVRAWEPHRTKRGGRWHYQTVRRILMRRENGGEYSYAGVTVSGGIPALVPMEEAERAARILSDRHRPRTRAGANSFALTGELFDGADGSPMTGTSGTSKSGATYRYYRCRSCGRTVGREDVEARVAGTVREALGDPGNRERIAELLVAAESERGGERKQSELIEDELAGIEVSFSNIWAAIESGVAPPGGKERIDALRRRRDLLREELSVAKAVEAAELDRERALLWLEAMARGMDDESILRTFVSRVVLGGPGGGDGLSVAFTFDSAAEGGDLALGASPGEAGDMFGQLGGRFTIGESRGPAFRMGERALACFGV